jgi:polar amino acid transport system ATP-binding protein
MSAEFGMEVIGVEHLSKSFGAVDVLKDITFSVRKGEVLGVLGPSGSGKSTLLRCLAQLDAVDGGTVRVCGDVLVAPDPAHPDRPRYAPKNMLRQIGLKIGLVFQNFNLFPHFSVLRNLTEAQIHVLGVARAAARENARRLLAKMGLSDKAEAYPFQLSGGQQQRVSIARALALNPEVLCFDEPTSALDPELTGEILKVIRALAAEKMTMVVVTHEMAFARDLADHVIFMDRGVVVERGLADEVISRPQQERTRAFLGRLEGRDGT